MSSILFSANPNQVNMEDVVSHLRHNKQLYFEVAFPIRSAPPLTAFIHISGDKIRFAARIIDILPFDISHYQDPGLAGAVKPEEWLVQWRRNIGGMRDRSWKHALVIDKIVRFDYDTYDLKLSNKRKYVTRPPQQYCNVLPPSNWRGF